MLAAWKLIHSFFFSPSQGPGAGANCSCDCWQAGCTSRLQHAFGWAFSVILVKTIRFNTFTPIIIPPVCWHNFIKHNLKPAHWLRPTLIFAIFASNLNNLFVQFKWRCDAIFRTIATWLVMITMQRDVTSRDGASSGKHTVHVIINAAFLTL